MTLKHTGGCLCGAVRYEIDGPLDKVQFCHCGKCRKAQGSAFASNLPVARSAFRLTQGEDSLQAYESSPGKRRWFCGRCGSPIYSAAEAAPDKVRIRAGTLDAAPDLQPAFHFYVGSKAEWWTITDELPRYEGPRPL